MTWVTSYTITFLISIQYTHIMSTHKEKEFQLNGILLANRWLNEAILNHEEEHVIAMYRRILETAIEQHYSIQ